MAAEEAPPTSYGSVVTLDATSLEFTASAEAAEALGAAGVTLRMSVPAPDLDEAAARRSVVEQMQAQLTPEPTAAWWSEFCAAKTGGKLKVPADDAGAQFAVMVENAVLFVADELVALEAGTSTALTADKFVFSKSARKKKVRVRASRVKSHLKALAAEAARAEQEAAKLAKSKSVVLERPDAAAYPSAAIEQLREHVGGTVSLRAWVHNKRVQGGLIFLQLRDGTGTPGLVQVVLSGNMCKTFDALTLAREASVLVMGSVKEDERAPGGVEVRADFWEVIGRGDPEMENLFSMDSEKPILYEQRHLVHRDLTQVHILKLRSQVTQCFREYFFREGFTEVTPPTLVQTQVEGGSTLFKLDYFGEESYLTQSSQLYLESIIPAVGKAFCCAQSYRAEKSRTRRHLAEFTHFEGELAFIEFEDLLDLLERSIKGIVTMADERFGALIREVNPDFDTDVRSFVDKPFRRMDYTEAIEWLSEHGVVNEETGEPYKFGEDIPEAPERHMVDTLGEPILLCRFPAEIKSFYMQRCPEDRRLTESVDVLMPGVGEIVGGSMRMTDFDELMAAFEHEGIDPSPYYWYTDLRKYGTCPHGGWGLGMERFLCWLLKQHDVRDVSLYPRWKGRCKP